MSTKSPAEVAEPSLDAISIVQQWLAQNDIGCQQCGKPASTFALAAAITTALENERERCAKIAEGFKTGYPVGSTVYWGEAIATAIRGKVNRS